MNSIAPEISKSLTGALWPFAPAAWQFPEHVIASSTHSLNGHLLCDDLIVERGAMEFIASHGPIIMEVQLYPFPRGEKSMGIDCDV